MARVALGASLALLTACGSAGANPDRDADVASGSTTPSTSSTTAVPTTTTLPPTTTTTFPPTDRTILDGRALPLAAAGGVELAHPSARVERVGFHESSILGAQELVPSPSAISASTLNTRKRGTGDRTAVDVVVQPGTTVVAPATGTVVAAGPYRLYCAYDDETVVIEPDGHPGWKVTLLHVQAVLVAAGQRVEAGTTPVAAQAHQLPFRSQVDRLAAISPPWPHVHLQIDDPAVADTPSKGDSC
jgi:murein DD-endopeptidase MepM/ murein hydrolase activator NlpD